MFKHLQQSPRLLVAIVLGLALLPCWLPLLEGRAWNGIGPMPFGQLNPPEGYHGPVPQSQITAESWGASSVIVPFHARLRHYLAQREWPGWNPYQGLGQPFASEGEGCPYSPMAIIRSLLPYTWGNGVTLLIVYISGIGLYLFLRGFSLSREAALLGAVGYIVSGAMTLQLARPNLADQLCTVPWLFWAAARMLRKPSRPMGALLGLISLVHLCGGFIQIAMLSALLTVVFVGFYTLQSYSTWRERFQNAIPTLACFVIGNGLGGFYLLPLAEAMQASFGKNSEHLAFIPMPYANVIAFFFPHVFGPYFQSWIPGAYPQVVDWDNLFAVAGISLFLLVAAGWGQRENWDARSRRLFVFFSASGVILLLRYISFPPLAVFNLVPLIGRQSPKHANGITVLMFASAAAFASDALRRGWSRRSHLIVAASMAATASCVITLTERQGGWTATNQSMALEAIVFSVSTGALLWWSLAAGRGTIAVFGLVAECAIYLPLGERSMGFLGLRLVLFCLVLASAWIWIRGRQGLAATLVAAAVIFYAAVVIPRSHLPDNVDLTQPSRGLRWLAQHTQGEARVFGVPPDFTSLSDVEGIEVLGPLAPPAFRDFVQLVSDEAAYSSYKDSCVFMLDGYYWRYSLSLYETFRPIFDAAGVKYLVLDKGSFGKRRPNPGTGANRLTLAYEDERIRILQSDTARPHFRFFENYRVLPSDTEILRTLHRDPSQIEGIPMIEASTGLTDHQRDYPRESGARLDVRSFRANSMTLNVRSDAPGVLATDDVYDRGWRVAIDGHEHPLLRVNGLFRGVYLDRPGSFQIRFYYLPGSVVIGCGLAFACGAVLLGLALSPARRGGSDGAPIPLDSPWLWGMSVVAALTVIALSGTYFQLFP